MAKSTKLGKGLGALLGENAEPENDKEVVELKLTQIEPNKNQPRKEFDRENLEVLAASIKQHGIIQPLVVQKQENGYYTIIAGERRWRAARIAGVKTVPVVVREYAQEKILEIALVENLQREDLNPIDEAQGYQALMDQFHLTQEEISKRVGKSRSAIANMLRLQGLPPAVQKLLKENKLTSGHGRTIASLDNQEEQMAFAQKIIDDGLSVRAAEEYLKKLQKKPTEKNANKNIETAYLAAENRLASALGTKVKIINGKKKGKIEIEYFGTEELNRLLKRLEG